MDSTPQGRVTCDSCPLQHGCPVFASGRTACLFGAWPLTSTLAILSALMLLFYALPL
jgi:hypothetical protein